jgi:hypothetical protein
MINRKQNSVAWALMVDELEDAHEHLGGLVARLNDGQQHEMSDVELGLALGHVYSHLNRAWHRRNVEGEVAEDPPQELFDLWSQFPTDIDPF